MLSTISLNYTTKFCFRCCYGVRIEVQKYCHTVVWFWYKMESLYIYGTDKRSKLLIWCGQTNWWVRSGATWIRKTVMTMCTKGEYSLQWRHNGRDGNSNYQHHDCLLNRLLRRRSNKTPKLRAASPAFVRGIHRWPVNSPHKWPVTRKMFPFDDVIMFSAWV